MSFDELRDLVVGRECMHCSGTDKRKMSKERYRFKRADLIGCLDFKRGAYFEDVRYPPNYRVEELRGKRYPVVPYVSCNYCKTALRIEDVVPEELLRTALAARTAAA